MAGEEVWFPALSPDGTRLAVARRDPRTSLRDIWLMDLDKGTEGRLTDDPVIAGFPVWTDDATRIVFGSARAGDWEIYSQSASGGALTRPGSPSRSNAAGTFATSPAMADSCFSGASRTCGCSPSMGARSRGCWCPPRTAASRATDAGWPTPRPTRAPGIYVTTFPTPTGRWRVSTGGGEDPQWSRDGTELYFVAGDGSLMAVDVRKALISNNFASVRPEVLFRASFDRASLEFGSAYSPARDGKRFLVLENSHNETPLLTATINWAPSGPDPR